MSRFLDRLASGPPLVADGGTGWLIPPDDEDALVEVLVEALTFPRSRLARGAAGEELVRLQYSWPAVAERVAEVYDALGT